MEGERERERERSVMKEQVAEKTEWCELWRDVQRWFVQAGKMAEKEKNGW